MTLSRIEPHEPHPPPPFGTLRFTPAEWRVLLEDRSFLKDPDNDFAPRRLMGLPVEIVPDHWVG